MNTNDDDDVSRLEAEWTAVNAFREIIRVGTRGDSAKATYNNALDLGAEVCPEILGDESSVLRRARENDLAREYRQRAQAKSLLSGEDVDALELLRAELAEVKAMLGIAKGEQRTDRLKRRLNLLERAETELDPDKHSEHQLIFRDVYHVARDIPAIGMGLAFRDFELPDENVLRIRVFHPEKPEHISGADLIYERHRKDQNQVSIVAVQYKIWSDKTLSLGDSRMNTQIERLREFSCDRNLCTANDDDDFRFPFCAAFLRPTDQLQSPDQRLHSTGEHLPVCKIESCATRGPRGGRKLEYDNMRSVSLGHELFERLFNEGRIGSRALGYNELSELYERFEVLRDRETLLIHAQDFSPVIPNTI